MSSGDLRMDVVVKKLSVVCPHCRIPRPGERAQVGERIVTLCYCNACGVTWSRDDRPARGADGDGARGARASGRPHTQPAATDLLLRGSFAEGYELVEVASGAPVASGLNTLEEVLTVARRHGGEVWQQQTDRFGQSIGPPIRLTLQAL
jgi:hypothetical protein